MPRVEPDSDTQGVPKPDWYQGNDLDSWVMTGQDGRLASEPGAGSFKTIEDVRSMRNPRPIDKH
jgi:hypothetical protein